MLKRNQRQDKVAELAAITELRKVGLSGRRTLAADGKMLLMLHNPESMCLWMRKVYFPLDTAFIDAGGKVVGVAKMEAHIENILCPLTSVCYALEVTAGWLENHQVTVGTQFLEFSHRKKMEWIQLLRKHFYFAAAVLILRRSNFFALFFRVTYATYLHSPLPPQILQLRR